MKKLFFCFLAAIGFGFSANAADSNACPTIDAGIGVGVYDKGESTGATFTQRIGAEWEVAKFNNKFSLAAGLYLNNSYSSYSTDLVMGKWEEEYKYNITRDDISILPTASLRYNFSSNIEAYFSLGAGIGILKASGDLDDIEKEEFFTDPEEYKQSETKVCFAMSACIGVRYYLSENWGVNAQFGMIAGNLQSQSSSFNLFSVGASYRF